MIQTATELAAACVDAATKHKTLYVMGCIGAPMTGSNKTRYTANHTYNQKAERKAKIQAASEDTFGFDCVCLIKSLLWGWNGDGNKVYGGAKYASRGVPDIGTEQLIGVCSQVSTDFSDLEMGELLWLPGHVGIYIGCGLAVECTPSWKDGVQITAVHNIGKRSGYNGRTWKKHGKLPYVTYDTESDEPTAPDHTQEETEEDKPVIPAQPQSNHQLSLPMLQKGSRGEAVKALQILLIGTEPGYTCGKYGVDGDFGSATENAVRNFQKAKSIEVDGIVGSDTWSCLLGIK